MSAAAPATSRYVRHCSHSVLDAIARVMEYLGQAVEAGMLLVLVCDRQREGLKSVRPCLGRQQIHVRTLIATLGPACPIEELPNHLRCPKCGSRHFQLIWTQPVRPPEPPRRRQMKPVQPG